MTRPFAMTVVLDLATDVLCSLDARRLRTALTTLVFALGAAGVLVSVCLGEATSLVVAAHLTPSDLDQVVVQAAPQAAAAVTASAASSPLPNDTTGEQASAAIPADEPWPTDVENLALALPHVRAAGLVWSFPNGDVRATLLRASTSTTRQSVAGMAATTSYLQLAGAVALPVSSLDALHGSASDHVALIGAEAARTLGLKRVGPGSRVWIGYKVFDVVGIISSASRDPSLATSVVVSAGGLRQARPNLSDRRALVLRTDSGYAAAVARIAAVGLRPDQAQRLHVDTVIDLFRLRRGVAADLQHVVGVIAVVMLCVAGLLVGNATLVSVLTRQSEVGLRRALGATRAGVATLFLAESATLALLGGLLGVSFGIVLVDVVCWARGWIPVIDHAALAYAPVSAVAMSVLGSVYPAWRASRVPPSIAVRAG